jgi:hypothetical protein
MMGCLLGDLLGERVEASLLRAALAVPVSGALPSLSARASVVLRAGAMKT